MITNEVFKKKSSQGREKNALRKRGEHPTSPHEKRSSSTTKSTRGNKISPHPTSAAISGAGELEKERRERGGKKDGLQRERSRPP